MDIRSSLFCRRDICRYEVPFKVHQCKSCVRALWEHPFQRFEREKERENFLFRAFVKSQRERERERDWACREASQESID
jgi:hypothetical protein